MDKRSITLLNFLTASVLNITAQSILLAPHRQEVFFSFFPPQTIRLFAIFLFFVGYFNIHSALTQQVKGHHWGTYITSAVTLSALSFIYQRASLPIESVFLIGLAISHIIAIRQFSKAPSPRHYLVDIVSTINLLIGISLFALPAIQGNFNYQILLPWNIYLGGTFAVTAGFGFYANKPDMRPYSSIFKLTSLPWLAWAAFFIFSLQYTSVILVLLLAATIIFSDYPIWEKIILPQKDMLGTSIFPILYIFQTLTVILLYFIVYVADISIISGSRSVALQDVAFFFSLGLTIFSVYTTAVLHKTINLLVTDPIRSQAKDGTPTNNVRISKFAGLFSNSIQDGLYRKTEQQEKLIREQTEEIKEEKKRAGQYQLLDELRKQLEEPLDEPVSAQIVVNTVQRAFDVELVAILLYDIENSELTSLSAAGKLRMEIPPGYRQSTNDGLMGRAARLRKTQISRDTRTDPDYIQMKGQAILTEVVVPLVHHGHLSGVLSVNSEKLNAFSNLDIETLEIVADELVRSWDRSGYNQRLTELIQTSSALTTSPEPEIAIHEIATAARRTLQARFVFATLFDQDGRYTRFAHAGYAPNLLKSLEKNLESNRLLQYVIHKSEPFRIRDIRRHKTASSIVLDHNMMRSLLAIPIRLHGFSIGAILAFGKQGGLFFNEKDESLSKLLTSQAAAAIKSSKLMQELRTTAHATKLLSDLSSHVIQTDNLENAAHIILEITHQITKASVAGIILFDIQKNILAALEVDSKGMRASETLPMGIIEQTLTSGKSVMISTGQSNIQVYLPIQTPTRKYGVLWIESQENNSQNTNVTATLQTLTNQAAIALERVIFLLDLRKKATELKGALTELEITYDQTLSALTAALDARDHETEDHSSRVGQIACLLGAEINLSRDELTSLRRGAILHDIGKIGISDNILLKPAPLTNEEWQIMRTHPNIGASIVQGIPFLKDTIPIIRHHHERWNGRGYPLGLQEEEIPFLARIFAVADVFDALTSQRLYRDTSSNADAFNYLHVNSGILFDPAIVSAFERLLSLDKID